MSVNRYCKYYNKHLETISLYLDCLYAIEGCMCAGILHTMISDDNLDDETIKWTLQQCEEHPEREEAEIGKIICKEFLKLSIPQRRLVQVTIFRDSKCSDLNNCKYCYIEVGD